MWDGHSCPSPLTLGLKLNPNQALRKHGHKQNQNQKRRPRVSVPHKPSAAACPILLFAPFAKKEPALREVEGVGTLTSHLENQNPNGLTLMESHLSQRTRKMGHPAESPDE